MVFNLTCGYIPMLQSLPPTPPSDTFLHLSPTPPFDTFLHLSPTPPPMPFFTSHAFAHSQEPGTSPLTVQLCGVSLGYATTSLSDPFITVPPKQVNYVERCDCPLNRRGPRCENCSPGYTTDPSFGGEFARCVRCFCNFHSASCDPVSGECFDCGDNTEGPDCEKCVAGYFRESGLRTDPCVQCECSETGTEGGACRAVSLWI